jgi:hypothetical protein
MPTAKQSLDMDSAGQLNIQEITDLADILTTTSGEILS